MNDTSPQKGIFIVYNTALHGLIIRILEKNHAKGYTEWDEVTGRGSRDGEPHLGSHAWPTVNGALMTFTEAHRVPKLLEDLHQLDLDNPMQGLRAFAWDITDMI